MGRLAGQRRQRVIAQAVEVAHTALFEAVEKLLIPGRVQRVQAVRVFDESAGGLNHPVLAGLSFIGLGVRPPQPEWGIMVAEGAQYIVSGEWWVALFPGAVLMLAVFCFNLLGDGLRDIIDPRRRT